VMAEIKFANVTTLSTMRSIVRLIVMGRLCELCVILLVDSMSLELLDVTCEIEKVLTFVNRTGGITCTMYCKRLQTSEAP
jgi:hypothetical protein